MMTALHKPNRAAKTYARIGAVIALLAILAANFVPSNRPSFATAEQQQGPWEVWRLRVPSQAQFGWPTLMVSQATYHGHTSLEWNWPAVASNVIVALIVLAIAAFAGNRIGSAIDSIRDSRRAKQNLCPACRYDLTGNTSGFCPECGSKIEKGSSLQQ